MRLTPSERDRLLLFTAAELARSRRGRGLRLNVPETIAIIADTVCEAARDGACLADATEAGRQVLTIDDVLPGVAQVVSQVQVEAVFADGTRLAVVSSPIGGYQISPDAPGTGIPGHEVQYAEAITVKVINTAAVPVGITSHFHFFEVNKLLLFDRAAAYGRRLAVPAGVVTRFAPGATMVVALTPIRGKRIVIGFAGLVDGPLDAPGAKEAALQRARAGGYLDTGAAEVLS